MSPSRDEPETISGEGGALEYAYAAAEALRVLNEETVLAGYPGGDRNQTLANVRAMRAALAQQHGGDRMSHPLDEPTTLDRHDLPADPPNIPHRHPDTDIRPIAGFLLAAICGAALLVVGLYYWLAP